MGFKDVKNAYSIHTLFFFNKLWGSRVQRLCMKCMPFFFNGLRNPRMLKMHTQYIHFFFNKLHNSRVHETHIEYIRFFFNKLRNPRMQRLCVYNTSYFSISSYVWKITFESLMRVYVVFSCDGFTCRARVSLFLGVPLVPDIVCAR